jgi:hypothetical protein
MHPGMMAGSMSKSVSKSVSMTAARETRRNPGDCQNCRSKNQFSHLCTRQSVSIAPTSAWATTTPFTLALP